MCARVQDATPVCAGPSYTADSYQEDIECDLRLGCFIQAAREGQHRIYCEA